MRKPERSLHNSSHTLCKASQAREFAERGRDPMDERKKPERR
ncbi:hypothetical protein ALQ33_101363 [Pseudomonas syringae pv. philadelphi]|uniref:Uncharacterized protein n=3 Tax=Pseudomonas syringae group TaxID=136849 RepID=A0A0P9M974_PSECA|nr:Unknown protein sequence [Pseudomonas syringae pv. maculicola]KPW64650.1 hypothetical protein ALO81_101531 [Pseudomonas cannabina]RMN12372.1 hypothetical protein ALQ65_101446 [Pseudomonas syringae pv. coriandricola]RMN86588.1 hypothetical protein ALQ52_103156 [Pseudomonas cannabina pv. alisalensis]RMO93774.1 hypothetical protein ALQ33_101363 [Pseudomonas syringae pv. philadelphi]